jgi:hypothetical protein
MSNVPKSKIHVCFGGLVICPPYYKSKKRGHYRQASFLFSAPYSITKTGELIVTKFRATNLLYNYSVNFIAVAYKENLS